MTVTHQRSQTEGLRAGQKVQIYTELEAYTVPSIKQEYSEEEVKAKPGS